VSLVANELTGGLRVRADFVETTFWPFQAGSIPINLTRGQRAGAFLSPDWRVGDGACDQKGKGHREQDVDAGVETGTGEHRSPCAGSTLEKRPENRK
jgi:hypothetical protein